ncbi:MAG: Holliday junction branch migration protein RuvA [Oscillospiraceae bacterium]|nr:Holliday junction branch migration protein RuvA [Oscillospiraceae bacterium]
MIDSLHGTLLAKELSMAVIECGGVGYACRISYQTYSKLGNIGEEIFLYTILSVSMREGNLELYGFLDAQERRCFSMLTAVGSVGGKAALAILSDMTPERLALVIASNDSKALTKVKGIGTKMAQRIVLELKDKIAKEQGSVLSSASLSSESIPPAESEVAEALSALTVLGYTQVEVMPILAKLPADLSATDLIKETLKAIGKQR